MPYVFVGFADLVDKVGETVLGQVEKTPAFIDSKGDGKGRGAVGLPQVGRGGPVISIRYISNE